MSETDNNKIKNIKSKTLLSFKTVKNIYNNQSKENLLNNIIIEYSYPICILKNIKKESEEIRKIQYRLIRSKKEQELKEKTAELKKLNRNLKRSLSSKIILSNNVKNSLIQGVGDKKKLIRSKSNPLYPINNQENNIFKKGHLSQIEKRGNYYNKILIASLQRHALNNYSLSNFMKNDLDNLNSILNKKTHLSEFEELENKKSDEFRQFLNNRIIAVNEKKNNIDEYFILNKKQIFPKIQKGTFKFHVFHDINGLEKELTKPAIRTLKMTKNRIRDLKVMASINKIRDPDIIQKYKSLIYK